LPANQSPFIQYTKPIKMPPLHFTRINGSKLWHLALLEWWLQVHVDGIDLQP
jgi:asparagine synthase (glutamine-hydrolysing)